MSETRRELTSIAATRLPLIEWRRRPRRTRTTGEPIWDWWQRWTDAAPDEVGDEGILAHAALTRRHYTVSVVPFFEVDLACDRDETVNVVARERVVNDQELCDSPAGVT